MRLPRYSLVVGLVIGLLTATPTVTARQGDFAGVARYRLTASLDPTSRVIAGVGRIEWRNTTSSPVSDLRLLTPRNMWRHVTTLRVTSSGGVIDARRAAVAVAPRDGREGDETTWSVSLAEPVRPGHGVEVEMAWTVQPEAFVQGWVRSGLFVFAADWFPRIGVLTGEGWRTHQASGALVADFATYDVDVRLPSGWPVAASGRAIASQPNGDGTTRHQFRAESTTGFGWTTASSFVERTDQFSAAGAGPVPLRLLSMPGHAGHADRQLTAVKTALGWYTRTIGPFPAESLTVVDIPVRSGELPGATQVLPGLMPVASTWFSPWGEADIDRRIAIGIGDQYFRGRVAPDEAAHPELGSALVRYVADRALGEASPGRFVQVERYFRRLVAWPYADVRWDRTLDDTTRMPLVLLSLERLIGPDTTQAALSAYAARGAHRHPTPAEFEAIVSSKAGRDLSWFFRALSSGAASFDYGVASVASSPASNAIESTVVLRRLGDGVFPVEVLVTFGDGASLLDRWDGRAPTTTLQYRRGAPVTRVEVDPGYVLALDTSRTNNSWSGSPRAHVAARRWSARWALWFQQLLLNYAFFV